MAWTQDGHNIACDACGAEWPSLADVACQCEPSEVAEDATSDATPTVALPEVDSDTESEVNRLLTPDGSGLKTELALALIRARTDDKWNEARKAEVINKLAGTLIKCLENEREEREIENLDTRLRRLEETND